VTYHLDDENFLSGPFLYVEKLRTAPACIRPDVSATRLDDTQCSTSYEISFQNTIWEVHCNHLNDVESLPGALIHKASIAFKIQTSRCQSSWSRSSKHLYGNYLQRKCDHPDDRALPSGRGSKQERMSANFLKSRSHSCPSEHHMTAVRTAPRFYQARCSFEPAAYK
jgi:hypothetical protein